MPSNEERREVAARLREHAKTARRVGYACVLKNCTSEEECDGFSIEGCEACFNKSLNRLADLIEPEPERTCEYIGDEISGGCSVCRGWLDPACAYCPNCGARVEEEA